VGFSALGALVGPHLGNIKTYGFAMAFPAVFLVLMRGMWRGIRAARPWLVSLLVASIVHLTVPGAWFIIAPHFVVSRPEETVALVITLIAASCLSMLPTVVIAVTSLGLLKRIVN
jgi:hypothetical protein